MSAVMIIPFLLSPESNVGVLVEGGDGLLPDHQFLIESTRFSDEWIDFVGVTNPEEVWAGSVSPLK